MKERNNMSIFICEKCGKIDNSANRNNYWPARANQYAKRRGDIIRHHYVDEYFDTHTCCALCCKGLIFEDGSGEGYFCGDIYDTVTDRTYHDLDEATLKSCENYFDILDRDSHIQNQ